MDFPEAIVIGHLGDAEVLGALGHDFLKLLCVGLIALLAVVMEVVISFVVYAEVRS